ncbi:MAG: hypothetical protein P8J87_05300, partial [Verrucomicrobiales bacterium]|nr:hypothetical protein [Verrucomicrobiales bacterium]
MKGKELERLIGAHLDGELTEVDAETLGAELEGSAAARREFWELAAVHGLTQEATRLEWLEAAGTEVGRRVGCGVVRWLAPLAAAAVLVLGFLLWPEGDGEERVAGVAVLSRVAGAEWGGEERRAGDVLGRGELRLGAGAVMVEFYSGARVVLEGPAVFEVVSESAGFLQSGSLTVEVPPQAKGFTVGVEGFKVVDLGTSFGMSVGGGKETEVHVFDGEVEVLVPGAGRALFEGEAVRLRGGELEAMAADQGEFLDEGEFAELEAEAVAVRRASWAAAREALVADRAAVVYYDFEGGGDGVRTVVERVGGADGSLVGGNWTMGRWAGEGALGLRGEGGRVRVEAGESMPAVTLMAWVRFDRLDFALNALLMPDASETGTLRWEVGRGGRMRTRERERSVSGEV